MIVVDASVLFTVVVNGPHAEWARAHLLTEDQAAPHLIDAEVLGPLRRGLVRGAYDQTTAGLAIEDLRDWPGERIGHRGLLDRAWELRNTVRPTDGLYVALAEALDAPLITLDARLARASGPTCNFILPS